MIHSFIFSPGVWLGEGKMSFNISPEAMRFFTKWTVEDVANPQIIQAAQIVETPENEDSMRNFLTFTEITEQSFVIQFENELIGKFLGKGVIDEKTIAWEVRDKEGFEGFEVYELQENGEYILHAEYASSPHVRTIIDGRLWKKASSD